MPGANELKSIITRAFVSASPSDSGVDRSTTGVFNQTPLGNNFSHTSSSGKKFSSKLVLGALSLVLLLVGSLSVFYLAGSEQDLRQQASVDREVYEGDPGTRSFCERNPGHQSCQSGNRIEATVDRATPECGGQGQSTCSNFGVNCDLGFEFKDGKCQGITSANDCGAGWIRWGGRCYQPATSDNQFVGVGKVPVGGQIPTEQKPPVAGSGGSRLECYSAPISGNECTTLITTTAQGCPSSMPYTGCNKTSKKHTDTQSERNREIVNCGNQDLSFGLIAADACENRMEVLSSPARAVCYGGHCPIYLELEEREGYGSVVKPGATVSVPSAYAVNSKGELRPEVVATLAIGRGEYDFSKCVTNSGGGSYCPIGDYQIPRSFIEDKNDFPAIAAGLVYLNQIGENNGSQALAEVKRAINEDPGLLRGITMDDKGNEKITNETQWGFAPQSIRRLIGDMKIGENCDTNSHCTSNACSTTGKCVASLATAATNTVAATCSSKSQPECARYGDKCEMRGGCWVPVGGPGSCAAGTESKTACVSGNDGGACVPNEKGCFVPVRVNNSCDPNAKISSGGKEGAVCCGGGAIECATGICNADAGTVGVCGKGSTRLPGTQTAEFNTTPGIEDTSVCDETKINGMVVGDQGSGFTLVCDFDGNNNFGYQTASTQIKGHQAGTACRTLCGNTSIDINAQFAPIASTASGPGQTSGAVGAAAGATVAGEYQCPSGADSKVGCERHGNDEGCHEDNRGCWVPVTQSVCGTGVASQASCEQLGGTCTQDSFGCWTPNGAIQAAAQAVVPPTAVVEENQSFYQQAVNFFSIPGQVVAGFREFVSNFFTQE